MQPVARPQDPGQHAAGRVHPPGRQVTAVTAAVAGRPTLALCHEWLVSRYGSEKTFEAMASALPEAELHALSWDRSSDLSFDGRAVRTTFLDRPGPLRHRRDLQLPLMPLAWRLAGGRRRYDVVVTSSHACAKGFRPARPALHLCYCYTPLRYVWLPTLDQRRRQNPLTRAAASGLRRWDLASVAWVDEFAAISHAVRQRIERIYQRPARVIFPPVDTDFFTPDPGVPRGDFALMASRMIPYKRIDMVIRACRTVGIPLVVAGSGPDEDRLRALAAGAGSPVRFVIAPSDDTLRQLYRTATMLVFPAEEDFGIVAVEAQACGTPVVALAAGGSLDTVRHGTTGVLVADQDEASLAMGIGQVLAGHFEPHACRDHAESFSTATFRAAFTSWVQDAASSHGLDLSEGPAAVVSASSVY
ncbi:MAG: glycosyltransferase [Acidimicrobiales bacterium]